MILFAALIALLVFAIRKPLRRYKPIDLSVFQRLEKWVTPSRSKWMVFITFLGKHQFLIPANLVLIFYFLLVAHQSWFSVRVLTIALSSLVLMLCLKSLFKRKRPLSPLLQAAKGLSFPSGHAIMAVTFYGLLLYILWGLLPAPAWRTFFTVIFGSLIFLIGFSRVYLRVHYASDVMSGFIIGLLWLQISIIVLNRLQVFVS
jgi:undecaprenyl-diphosphatase